MHVVHALMMQASQLPDYYVPDSTVAVHVQEQQNADLALALAEASSLLYDPYLLELGTHNFVQVSLGD